MKWFFIKLNNIRSLYSWWLAISNCRLLSTAMVAVCIRSAHPLPFGLFPPKRRCELRLTPHFALTASMQSLSSDMPFPLRLQATPSSVLLQRTLQRSLLRNDFHDGQKRFIWMMIFKTDATPSIIKTWALFAWTYQQYFFSRVTVFFSHNKLA